MTSSIRAYWQAHPDFAAEARAAGFDPDSGRLPVRGVLFDMDGVLYDSMPYHAIAWQQACQDFGLAMTREEVFMNEGRTGFSTINILTLRSWGRDTTQDEVERIYARKCEIFNAFPPAPKMPGAEDVLRQAREAGLRTTVVTGSGQASLLDRLDRHYHGYFDSDLIVSSRDVKHGKPSPEPYLMGLAKLGLRPWEALVVENAPLGVRAGVAAGIMTIAANTGPLPASALLDEGANLLFPSMTALAEAWPELTACLAR